MGGGFSKIEPFRMCLDNICGTRPYCVAYEGDSAVDGLNWVRRFNTIPPDLRFGERSGDSSKSINCARIVYHL